MAKKSENIFVRAKAYVKDHPRTAFQDAIKIVSGKKTVGSSKKKSTPVSRKKAITGTRKAVASPKPVARKTGTMNGVKKGEQVLKNIERLEKKYANAKRGEKEFYRVAINAEHKKLSAIQKSL